MKKQLISIEDNNYEENLYYEHCTKCKGILIHDNEMQNGICDSCADKLINKYNEQKEWDYYHNG